MCTPTTDCRLLVDGPDDYGPVELERITLNLACELRLLPDIALTETKSLIPSNAKAGEVPLIAQIAIAVLGTGGLAASLCAIFKEWLLVNRGCKLRMKVGEQEVEITAASVDDAEALIAIALTTNAKATR